MLRAERVAEILDALTRRESTGVLWICWAHHNRAKKPDDEGHGAIPLQPLYPMPFVLCQQDKTTKAGIATRARLNDDPL